MTLRRAVFKLLGVGVGLAIIVIGFQERSAIRRVRSVGVSALVEPINSYTRTKSKGSTTYSALFTFKTDDGRVIAKKRTFPDVLLRDLEQGAPVHVLYDPHNPSDFVFEKESAPWWPFGAGAAFLAVAIFVL